MCRCFPFASEHINEIYEVNPNSVVNDSKEVLEKIYENESHIAYYYEELGTIYLFVKEDFSLICRMVIGDDNRHSNKVSIEDAKELVSYYEHGEYTQFIEYMYDHQLISDHTYKKLNKKVK